MAVETATHDWWVFSTAVADGAVLVECRNTGARGVLADPTDEDWRRAFQAPSKPYRLEKNRTVVLAEAA